MWSLGCCVYEMMTFRTAVSVDSLLRRSPWTVSIDSAHQSQSHCVCGMHTQWVKKPVCHYTFVHNFDRYWPIFLDCFTVVFSTKFATKSMSHFPPHLKGVTTLPYWLLHFPHILYSTGFRSLLLGPKVW